MGIRWNAVRWPVLAVVLGGGCDSVLHGLTLTDEPGCCPPDSVMSSCMNLGGYSATGCPSTTCDFYCSANWRIENDTHGCRIWRYDTRAPQPGENFACFRLPDAGAGGAFDGADSGND